MTSKVIPASKLVLDFGLYPRHSLDAVNLRRISDALDAGARLPNVVADAKSLKVADGFHRVTVALRRDPDAKLGVELVAYADETALFLDAVARNAVHGKALTPYDVARVISIAEDWKIDPVALHAALAIPLAVADKIKISRTAFSTTGKTVVLKRSASHKQGAILTDRQVEANEHLSGMPASFHAAQLILMIDSDLINWSDEATVELLAKLATLLSKKRAA